MIALALIAAQIADLFTFAQMVSFYGIGGEANPFVRWLYAHTGFWGVAAGKGVVTVFFLFAVSALPEPLKSIAIYVAVIFSLLAAGTNTLAVVLR